MKHFLLAAFIVMLLAAGCSTRDAHFITDESYREQVETDFNSARLLAVNRDQQLFGVLDQDITTGEREALMFLYAYMPLNDLADYDGNFFLQNVRLAFAARDSFSWGRQVPEDVFRHFVLPYRVNNENLDSSRSVFFKELLPRVQRLSMKEAALEVNHWCHEKVNYQGTDGRTISPLGAICTAYGRCGEESTFTVTALRAVAIPARQVYTPRWAHVDDNHAWVEVWIDGKWQFMGACEPAPDLNQGWFAAPALRTMMVHTNAFGRYTGSEKVLQSFDKYARLNLLSNYAPVKQIAVKVVGANGQSVEGARVDFGLYNYAEFYTLHHGLTEKNGVLTFETGLGDLQVWACDDRGNFNVSRLTAEITDTLVIPVTRKPGDDFVFESDNIPPVAKEPAAVSVAGQEENERRIRREDSIRNGYVATFISEVAARALAGELGLDGERFWMVMQKSRGHWPVVSEFFKQTPAENRPLALLMTETIAEKDLHDTPADVLSDHLAGYLSVNGREVNDDTVRDYLFNPRIDLEMLTPYRQLFLRELGSLRQAGDNNATADAVAGWIRQNIISDSINNHYRIRISPVGVFGLRRSDGAGLDLFFVAVCRSLGVPARLEPATRVPQYFHDGWVSVSFAEGKPASYRSEKGWLKLTHDPEQQPEPLYYIHFSLARFNGTAMKTLEFEEMMPVSRFAGEIELEPGYYRLLTGNRLGDGTVLLRQTFFNIEAGVHKTVEMHIRHEQTPLAVVARWPENPLKLTATTIVGWLDPHTEPGRHFMVDLAPVKQSFEKAGYPLVVFTTDITTANRLKDQFPKGSVVATDPDWQLARAFGVSTALAAHQSLPVFVVINPAGEVLYHTSGYQIGTGEQLLKVMQREQREHPVPAR